MYGEIVVSGCGRSSHFCPFLDLGLKSITQYLLHDQLALQLFRISV